MVSPTSKRAILHVPHYQLLTNTEIDDWIKNFQLQSLMLPTEVALPAVGYGGISYDSSICPAHASLSEGNKLSDWIARSRYALGGDVPIWATINPSLAFSRLETLMVEDQYEDRIRQACIVNEKTQAILTRFISELVDLGVDGIVLDLTDLYPNSSYAAALELQNTCFCSYCMAQLISAGWSGSSSSFKGDTNISRLILKVDEIGTDHTDPRHDWIVRRDGKALAMLAEENGFVDVDEGNEALAEELLSYLAARGVVTARAVKGVLAPAREMGVKTAAILGTHRFDIGQGIDAETLAAQAGVDECWVPGVNRDFVSETHLTVNYYLAVRATYYLNALIEELNDIGWTVLDEGEPRTPRLMRRAQRAAGSNDLNAIAPHLIEEWSEYSGYVAWPVSRSDTIEMLQKAGSLSRRQVIGSQIG